MGAVRQNMEGPGASVDAVRFDEYFKVWQSAIGFPKLAEEGKQSVIVEQNSVPANRPTARRKAANALPIERVQDQYQDR